MHYFAIALVTVACWLFSALNVSAETVNHQTERAALEDQCRGYGILVDALRKDNKDRGFTSAIAALEGSVKLCQRALGYLDELIAATPTPAGASAPPVSTTIPKVVPSPKMMEVAAMVLDSSIPVLMRTQHYFGEQPMGTTIVFVHKGKRYSLYHSSERIRPDDPNSAWLSFWVRKNGTSGQHNLMSFTDNGFDGKVDFGIDGPRQRYFKHADRYSAAEGLEHEAFWQKELDVAINAALEYKRSVTTRRVVRNKKRRR